MNTFLSPSAVAIPMSGISASSHELDKALVYDAAAGHYVLMSAEHAQVEVLVAKRSARISWVVRVALVLVLCLVSGILGFVASIKGGDSWRTAPTSLTDIASRVGINPAASLQAPTINLGAPALPPVVAASTSVALAPAAGASTALVIPVVPSASQPVLTAVIASPVAPASTPTASASATSAKPVVDSAALAPVQVAHATVFSASTPSVAEPVVKAIPTPPPVPTPVAKAAPAAKPAAPKEVVKNPTPVTKVANVQATAQVAQPAAPRTVKVVEASPPKPVPVPVGVQRVTAQGLYYFDGTTSKLFAVGTTLPNGEKIIEVDEASATYATDKSVRQIRSPKP